jgi:hypothetical protein
MRSTVAAAYTSESRATGAAPRWVVPRLIHLARRKRGESGARSDDGDATGVSAEGPSPSIRPTRPNVPKAPIKIGKEKRMEDPYDEGVANRIGPESCVGDREVAAKR